MKRARKSMGQWIDDYDKLDDALRIAVAWIEYDPRLHGADKARSEIAEALGISNKGGDVSCRSTPHQAEEESQSKGAATVQPVAAPKVKHWKSDYPNMTEQEFRERFPDTPVVAPKKANHLGWCAIEHGNQDECPMCEISDPQDNRKQPKSEEEHRIRAEDTPA